MVVVLSTNIKLLQTSFDLLTDRLAPSMTNRLLIMYGILLRQLFFVLAVACSRSKAVTRIYFRGCWGTTQHSLYGRSPKGRGGSGVFGEDAASPLSTS